MLWLLYFIIWSSWIYNMLAICLQIAVAMGTIQQCSSDLHPLLLATSVRTGATIAVCEILRAALFYWTGVSHNLHWRTSRSHKQGKHHSTHSLHTLLSFILPNNLEKGDRQKDSLYSFDLSKFHISRLIFYRIRSGLLHGIHELVLPKVVFTLKMAQCRCCSDW